MNYLVTGGTGFVGAQLVRYLLRQGESRVAVFDRRADMRHLSEFEGQVEFIKGDVADRAAVNAAVTSTRPATIFHLGAMLAPECDRDPRGAILANALGTQHVLEAARVHRVDKIILASTIGVLTPASQNSVLDDFSLTRPATVYGATKLFSENLGATYRRLHGVDFRALRLPAIVGAGVQSRGFAEYFNRALESCIEGVPYKVYVAPHTAMPVLYVKDAARAFVELALAPREKIKTGCYVVHSQETPTVRQLIDRLAVAFDVSRLSFEVDPAVQRIFDAGLGKSVSDAYARDEWGWKPEYGLQQMIDDFVLEKRGSSRREADL